MFGASEKLDRALGMITDFHGNQVPDAHTNGWLRIAAKMTDRGTLALPFVAFDITKMFMHNSPLSRLVVRLEAGD